jgi:hypothetical protein
MKRLLTDWTLSHQPGHTRASGQVPRPGGVRLGSDLPQRLRHRSHHERAGGAGQRGAGHGPAPRAGGGWTGPAGQTPEPVYLPFLVGQ